MKHIAFHQVFGAVVVAAGLLFSTACSQEEGQEVAALSPVAQSETASLSEAKSAVAIAEKRDGLFIMMTGQYCYYCGRFKQHWNPLYKGWEDKEKLYEVYLHGLSSYSPKYYNKSSEFYFNVYAKEKDFNGIPHMFVNLDEEWYTSRNLPTEYVDRPAIATSEVTATKYKEEPKARISYTAQSLVGHEDSLANKDLRVMFWLIEKSSVGYQQNYSASYEHRNLLRRVLFPTSKEANVQPEYFWGEPYELGSTLTFECSLKQMAGDLMNFPNLDNCYVMAILTDNTRKVVYEVAVADLKQGDITGIVLPQIGSR